MRDKYRGIYIKRIEGLFENIGTTDDGKNKPDERIFLYKDITNGWKISRGDNAYSFMKSWKTILERLQVGEYNFVEGKVPKVYAGMHDIEYIMYDARTPIINLPDDYLEKGMSDINNDFTVTLWNWKQFYGHTGSSGMTEQKSFNLLVNIVDATDSGRLYGDGVPPFGLSPVKESRRPRGMIKRKPWAGEKTGEKAPRARKNPHVTAEGPAEDPPVTDEDPHVTDENILTLVPAGGGGRKYSKKKRTKKRSYKNSKKKTKKRSYQKSRKRSYQNSRKSKNTKKRSKKRSKKGLSIDNYLLN